MRPKISYVEKMILFGALLDLIGNALMRFDISQDEIHKLFYRVEKNYFPDEKKKSAPSPSDDLPTE